MRKRLQKTTIRRKIVLKRGRGKTVGSKVVTHPTGAPMALPEACTVYLRVIRRSGDAESYKLAEMPDLRYVALYRRALAKVRVPIRLPQEWLTPKELAKGRGKAA